MSDVNVNNIVFRLRYADKKYNHGMGFGIYIDAANEITRLCEENTKLRELVRECYREAFERGVGTMYQGYQMVGEPVAWEGSDTHKKLEALTDDQT